MHNNFKEYLRKLQGNANQNQSSAPVSSNINPIASSISTLSSDRNEPKQNSSNSALRSNPPAATVRPLPLTFAVNGKKQEGKENLSCAAQISLKDNASNFTEEAPRVVAASATGPAADSYWSRTDFPHSRNVLKALTQVFKLSAFRTNQLEIINAALMGRDCFVLMPTGGGKSMCYQLPAIVSQGITVVVSPLLSLIQDQVHNLISRDIPALSLSSSQSEHEKTLIHQELQREVPLCKLYYVTPEMIVKSRVFQDLLRHLVQRNQVARFVIDEAHCVSQWGHEFRPDYKELSHLKQWFPNVPIMALTATATHKVELDISRTLNMKPDMVRFQQSFNRPNLRYYVFPKTKQITQDIVAFIKATYSGQSGIIYCVSKKECELMASTLQTKYGVSAAFYHAGLRPKDRCQIQDDWACNRIQVIVATIAFGMGIDKADVRFVIHYSLPKSLEGLYQETGRAGRDGLESVCILYYCYGDKSKIEFMIDRSDGNTFEKDRQRENLRQVIQYCENSIDCRRQQLLLHFGEQFDRKWCHKTCDCCERHVQFEMQDKTREALPLIRLVQSLNNAQVTQLQLLDIFRGSQNKRVLANGHQHLTDYGAGKDYPRLFCERLMRRLVVEDVLREYFVTNASGFATTYIKLGSEAIKVLQNQRHIILPVIKEK